MPSEIENRKVVRRKIVVTRTMSRGDVITQDSVSLKRANNGLEARYCELIIGMKLRKAIRRNDVLTREHIGGD